uniref:Uncharacterized protein n=1 Tax=Meloidogyne enterolobii TaxID=390850 RepID=A0A6V7XA69_MELEN|nr:unnamed protein product [Meloidogyne enterolobii]
MDVHFLILFIFAVLGTIPFYIVGELFPQNFRSTGQSAVNLFFFLSAFIIYTLTLPLYASIGVWCFLPLFIIPQIFCLTILWIFLPETRGREVHEIVDDLKKSSFCKRSVINT